MKPRIPLIQPGTRPELADIEAGILAERGRISPLYQALLNSPPLAAGWEALLTAIRNQSQVPADLRELMILRVAVLNGADFEFQAHLAHAARAGLTPVQIEQVRAPVSQAAVGEAGRADGSSATSLTPQCLAHGPAAYSESQRLALALVDAMTADIVVPDELMQALQKRHDHRVVLEMVATVAAYNMVSRLLVALQIGHRP